MKITVLGDIHGRWNTVKKIVTQEALDNGVILTVGDLCNYHFDFLNFEQKFIFVWGNHESQSFLKEKINQQTKKDKAYILTPGEIYTLTDGTTIAGLSGVYSQRFYSSSERPLKFYGQEDVEKMKTLSDIDILLFHDAPSGIGVTKNGEKLGRSEITDIIEAVQPKIVFFGHHHVSFDGGLGETRIIGLPQPKHGYVTFDTLKFQPEKVDAQMREGAWKYGWEQ